MSFENYYRKLKERLSKGLEGVMLDIDDTLCATNLHWAEFALSHFSNPEGISAQELIRKYKFVRDVPYFKKSVHEWVENQIVSNSSIKNIPVIEGATKFVEEIAKVVPIVGYLTGRPKIIRAGTEEFLRGNGFPKLEVVFQPTIQTLKQLRIYDGNEWKARLIEYLYPFVNSLVDDNQGLTKYLSGNYKGRLYLFSHDEIEISSPNVTCCKDWNSVLNQIRKNTNNEIDKQVIENTLVGVKSLKSIIRLSNAVRDLVGYVAEVGVYKGGSARLLCQLNPKNEVYLFDTFEGLPKIHPSDNFHKKGDFKNVSEKETNGLLRNYTNFRIYRGLFPQDTGEVIRDKVFKLVHLDIDIYRSYRDALNFFYPRMINGGVVILDDYKSAFCLGARKAVDDFMYGKPESLIVGPERQAHFIKGRLKKVEYL
jgi:hypothetical protein